MLLNYLKHGYRHLRIRWEGVSIVTDRPVERLGGEAGWPVCTDLIRPDSIVYSFGVGDNVGWDLEMISRFGVDVHAFDPTPASIAWVARQDLPRQFCFHDFGIAAFDGQLKFFPPKNPSRMHYSQDRQRHNANAEPSIVGEVRRLSTIARELGHPRIDVLKLDVEGTEFDCLPDILASGLEIDQLLVEIHYQHPSRSMSQGLALARLLESAGFECFSISQRALEFAFVHRRCLNAAPALVATSTGPR